MLPNHILKSSVLDIIFENRNKEYGAYTLRSGYNKRLATAITLTIFIALLFMILQSFQKQENHFKVKDFIIDDPSLSAINIIDKKDPKPLKPIVQPKQFKTINYQNVQIVKDPVIDKNVDVADIDDAVISTVTYDGTEAPSGVTTSLASNPGTAIISAPLIAIPVVDNSIHEFVESMPQFPGGEEALRKYILRNLGDAAQLEPEEKLVFKASFVVDKDGSITNITIEGDDASLIREVKRVISKMPLWLPGKQNGELVRVLFKLPVTFVGRE